jgi:signal peptidase I
MDRTPATDPAAPSSSSQVSTASGEAGSAAGLGTRHPDRWMRWLVPPALVLFAVILVRAFLVAPFSIPSGSMEPTLEAGDRILVNRTVSPEDLHRGDLIVFDASAAFGIRDAQTGLLRTLGNAIGSLVGRGSDTDYVKRIIGLPGDRVRCCAEDGRLLVNDVPFDEPYLFPGDEPSASPFEVVVPRDRFWVMGDHRSASADSRAYLGAPGGGTVPGEDIIGQVWMRYWPPGRIGTFPTVPQSATPRNGQ